MIQWLLIASVVVFLAGTSTSAQVAAVEADVRFVVLGHVRGDEAGGLNPKVHELLDEVRTLEPAFAVLTGDIIWGDLNNTPRDPERVEYEWNEVDAALSTLGVPIYRVPGNHDISDVGTRDIWLRRYGVLPRVVLEEGVRLLLLSSAWIPEDDDEDSDQERHRLFVRGIDLDENQVSWLGNELNRPSSVPSLVFMHHLLWWEPDDGRWWTEVHPLLARAEVQGVFSGDYGPLKFSATERDGVPYFQTSIEYPVSLEMLQLRVPSRVLSAQFDNFLEVIVRGQEVDVRVHTVGEVSSGEFTPSRHRAIVEEPTRTLWIRLTDFVGTPKRMVALLGGFGFAFVAGWWLGGRRRAGKATRLKTGTSMS